MHTFHGNYFIMSCIKFCQQASLRYFSLAHEIAHNLVVPHNSEHEFYFSAICERFMMDLTTLLTEGAS